MKQRVAILGGGPSALFVYKKFVDRKSNEFEIDIFEAGNEIGRGMPYDIRGASKEHVTNVSSNETPDLLMTVDEWLKQLPRFVTAEYGIDGSCFNEFKLLPRLLFGQYLSEQFAALIARGETLGIKTTLRMKSKVIDVSEDTPGGVLAVYSEDGKIGLYDYVIMCTGHHWPIVHEGRTPGYYDTPYPPEKIRQRFDHPVAIRGSSLTAIDAIRTLAREHGRFVALAPHKLVFEANKDTPHFKIVLHSTHGLLPAVRFHVDDPDLQEKYVLSSAELQDHMATNGGFVALDYIFQKNFKDTFKNKDQTFFNHIKNMTIEEFVADTMNAREKSNPFDLLEYEYDEAENSIKTRRSVYWKEVLGALSFAINYPAKHFSAEDMLRLKTVLAPLITIVIAYLPQSSCEELIALHDAGRLEIVTVGTNSSVMAKEKGASYIYTDQSGVKRTADYATFIDCMGQPHLPAASFPFKSLIKSKIVSEAFVKFRSNKIAEARHNSGDENVFARDGSWYLNVPGVAINDHFQALGEGQMPSARFFVMAVPYIAGHNPDYSGLDFCDEASSRVVDKILSLS